MNLETLIKTLTLSNGKECPLVQIGWIDAIENHAGWHDEQEALDWADNDNWIVHQTGWIIEENDDYLLLASRYDEPNENRSRQLSGLFKIPKPWILYRNKLVFENNL